jgi:cell division protein FtsI (penicillin-binding protein 3)
LVGFVDGSGTGREGMEATLDTWLRGESLVLQRRRDRHGMSVDDPVSWSRDVNQGMDVHVALDRSIQRIAERALEGVVERSAPLAATAVVVDVKTGDLLAMANVPTFNPNNLGSDAASRRNHVVQDAIEPGSVLKPFTAAAAVQEGLVTGATPIDCENGAFYIGRTRIRDDHPHGLVTVAEVIKYSSNIGSAKLALQVGAKRFLTYMRDFGFGQRSGVALPGERAGVLRSAEKIRPIELATTSYGQGMTTTPLQLAMATATLANGGVRMKPRLIKRIEDAHGVPEYRQNPAVAKRVVSEETAAEVTAMMVMVTEAGGTATRAQVPGYLVAGKTGTAEKVKNGVYTSARIGSFVGFVPADDPVLAIVVSVDEPSKGSRYGGIVAAPAFAEIAALSLRHLGIAPNPELLDPMEEVSDDALAVAEVEDLSLSWSDDAWTLPDLTGRTMREVMVGLHTSGLNLHVDGSGTSVSQTPAAGTQVSPGTVIQVTFE